MARKVFWKFASLLVAVALLLGAMPFGADAAPWDSREEENWSYAYYLGQEYLGNAGGAPVKPDPVGYGFQGVITELTFVDDANKSWTFVWSAEANGEWRITGRNVTEAEATAWPQVTNGGRYIGYCGDKAYLFTLSQEGSAEGWTYARNNHANWFYYIRFIREYTVNVFYQNETGSVVYNGVTYAAQDPLVREFHFLYPNGNIIDDSEYEDGEYTDPVTLRPGDYLTQDMKDQGYEIKYATDAQGNDVLASGVTISLLGKNVLNVYCTLIPPKTENYQVIHSYFTNGELDGTVSGGSIEVEEGADFADVVDGIQKLTDYSENSYDYTSYHVDPDSKTIELVYVRTLELLPPPEPVDLTVTKVWENDTLSLRPESILVQLYRDGEAFGDPVELNDANGWSNTWTGLDGGYTWTADELYIPRGYIKSVAEVDGILVITNTHTDPRIGDAYAAVTKIWDDNGYPDRPASVTVQLLCEGEPHGDPVVLNAENRWHYTWYQLNPDLTWTLEEIDVPEGYTATVAQDGFYFTVTNYMDYEPPTEPTEPPTEPNEPPTEPTEPPTEPTEPPTEPTEPPTEPTEPPTEPTEPPTEPTEPPTEPTEPPTEPTEPPTEPTEPPTEPTEPPTEPTEPPTEPTEPPTEPTEPPTEPTEPPTEATESPTYPVMPLDDEGDEPETTEPPVVVDVPITGGMLSAWIMVSAVSGVSLVGMLLTRKKEN